MTRLGRVLTISVLAATVGGCEFLPQPLLSQLQAPAPLPEPSGTYLNMGRHFLEQGDINLAYGAFIRSLRVEGVSAAALTGTGIALERQGLLHQARRQFERAVSLAPNSVAAHNNLGAVLYRMGEYNLAKQSFQAAFALSSGTSRTAEHNLGLTRMALRQVESDGLVLAPNPVPLQRLGSGEYILGVAGTEGQDE